MTMIAAVRAVALCGLVGSLGLASFLRTRGWEDPWI